MAKKALVFMAHGFEELEFTTIVDVLRRGSIVVTTACVEGDANLLVKGARNIAMQADCVLPAPTAAAYDAMIMPGGINCAKRLAASSQVGALLAEQERTGRLIGAICASPTVLKQHGIGKGKRLTSYPAMKDEMLQGGNYIYDDEAKVVVDGTLVTSRGPATAMPFALRLLAILSSQQDAEKIAKALLVTDF